MNPEAELDQRHYQRMLAVLDRLDQGHAGLGHAIGDLAALIESVSELDEAGRNEFRQAWGLLEDVYAVNLDQGAPPLSADDRRLIARGVSTLRALVRSRLKASLS